MALEENTNNGFYMPVAPAYGNGINNGGFGFGGDGLWFLILFFLLCGNGWGNGFGGFGGNAFAADTMAMYPWMNQSNQINDGFDHAATRDYLTGIQSAVTSGFGDVQLGIAGINQNLCQTGNSIINAVNTGFNAAESSANARQIANMQTAFAAQTAMSQGFNGVQAGLADAKYVEATEACATRTASAQNTRDIIDAQTRGTQAILDKLCALELDGVKSQLAQANRENVGLQNQLNMANLAASQTAQNALIQQGFANEVDALYNRLNSCPVPTTPVYGRTPIFTCGQTTGCGCGGNGFVN